MSKKLPNIVDTEVQFEVQLNDALFKEVSESLRGGRLPKFKHIIQNFNFTPVSFMNQIEYVKCSKIKQSDLDKKSQEKWFILYLLCLQ